MNKIIAVAFSLFFGLLSSAFAIEINNNPSQASSSASATSQAVATIKTEVRVPDVPYVFPADAPNLVESVFFISSLKGDVLTQIVSTNDKEKGPYFFLMTPPVGSKVLVDLENILLCLKKINPFEIGNTQGVYIRTPCLLPIAKGLIFWRQSKIFSRSTS